MRGQWPLVGRDSERQQLDALLRDPAARGVVLTGPPGVGKTRLATDVVDGSGRRVIRVSATRAAATIPLGAFAPYLPARGLGDTPDQSALRIATDAIVAGSDSDAEPPLVFVDDAHALDEASAALLLHLAIASSAFVLVTFRTGGESLPDALNRLWKDILPRIDLLPLRLEDVTALLEATLGGMVDTATVHRVHDACRGNALYLRELLDGLTDTGALEDRGGIWTLQGAITAPPRLVELVTARLDGLSGRERFFLEALALAEPMGLPTMREFGWAEEFDSLERKHLAEVRRSGRRQQVFVAHPMHAEVLRATITTRRRDAMLSQCAHRAIGYGLRRRDDARRAAVWQLDAGEHADPEVLLAAARDAFLVGDRVSAERFSRAALAGGAGTQAAVVLGLALADLGRSEEADEVLRVAQLDADEAPQDPLVAMVRGGNLFRGLTRADEAREVLHDAKARTEDGREHDLLVGQESLFALFEGDVATTLSLTDPLLSGSDDVAYCLAALPAAMIRYLNGRVEEAADIATKAYDVRVRTNVLELGSAEVFLVARAMALIECGRIPEAERVASDAYELAAAQNDRNQMAWVAMALSRVYMLTGRLQAAARLGSEGALLFGELNHPGTRWGYGVLALAAAQRGDADVAEEAIADLDAEPTTSVRMMDGEIERARAWTLAARGDLPRARTALLATANAMAKRQMHLIESLLLFDVARLGDASAVVDRIVACAKHVDGPMIGVRVQCTRAMADGTAAALEEAADAFETMDAILHAAEAANEAAMAYRRDGLTRPATAAAQRAQLLAARCEGARTPSLMHGTGSAVLTKREREIATLASHGMSSREIASTLYVSIRTVDNHLQHAYEKLGVTSRSELADALARAGL
jgi:DNA-binding CsgD family transcriptional regulator